MISAGPPVPYRPHSAFQRTTLREAGRQRLTVSRLKSLMALQYVSVRHRNVRLGFRTRGQCELGSATDQWQSYISCCAVNETGIADHCNFSFNLTSTTR